MTEAPRIYLLTPPEIVPESFPDRLARVLDAVPVACLRLDLASRDEARLTHAAEAVAAVARARELPVVIAGHVALAGRLGLDGVHLDTGAGGIRAARRALGAKAIVGAFAGTSRHGGLVAGEAGADYVSFGPVEAGGLGSGEVAQTALFEWWQQMVTVPVVAEGAITPDAAARLAPHVDFLAVGEEIWRHDEPAAALARIRDAAR
mgnify:CR=1 FL=1